MLERFGDIALAIGLAFEDYLSDAMNVLRQSGSITANPVSTCTFTWRNALTHTTHLRLDYELRDCLSVLREGILEAYTGIVTAFKGAEEGMTSSRPTKRVTNSSPVHLLQPHILDILKALKVALLDESHGDPVYGSAYGIIGRLGRDVWEHWDAPADALRFCRR